MEVFNEYSLYYDLLYKDKDYLFEVDYVLSLINKYSEINVKTILDLGCGTGRHDEIMAEKGYKVTGIDLSEQMIEIANKKKNENLQVHLGDVRNIRLNQKFDAIISLFHVANYQTSNEDIENFFKTAYDHLNKGGVFIFDFWYGPAVLLDLPENRIKRIENDKIKITRITEPEILPNENIVVVNFELIIEDKNNKHFDTKTENHKMRYFFMPELNYIIKQIGFKCLDTLKWLSNNIPLSDATWYGLLILQK